jgi:hypothetical protein
MAEGRPITPGLFVVGPGGPRLIAGRCAACRALHFPAASVCPYCAAGDCVETEVGPAARLWLHTVVSTRPPGYRGPLPYGFGVVEIDEGLRVVTRLSEPRPDRLQPGMAMRLIVEPLFIDDEGAAVFSYAFAPDAA